MAGKPYIKTGTSTWAKVKRIYIKSGGQTWAPIRKSYIKTGTSTWKKVFDTTSNRPFIEGNDRPKIRLNTFRPNSPIDFSGTANDPVNPVVEAPPVQQMGPPITTPTNGWPSGTIGNHLWGYDGDWKSGNGSAISYTYQWLYNLSGDRNDNDFDPAFSPAYSSTTNASNTSSTGRADMLTNNSTYLGRGFPGQSGTDGDYFDKNFLTFRVVATNSAGSVAEESDTQLYIVRQKPSGTINLINTSVDVPETLSASFTYQNEWYRKPDLSDSYIEWFAIDSAGEALTTSNRVGAIEYLNSIVTTGTTTKSGTVYHNATLENKIYTVRITLNNSNTQSAVIPISGFIPTSPVTQEDSTDPGSEISVTTLNILDYYNQKGTDNRGYIPVAGLFKIQSNVTGVNSSTTYRIRYRMYNWQNGSYYGMDGTNYGSAASSAWTTRTGSSTSSGFGGTLINSITVSGTTATLTHNESISSSSFGSTTYDGGQDRWQIEIEVSALKNSVRKYYADVVGGIPYTVSRAATSTLSASPSNAQVNENVTLSGSFGGLGGGSSYPRQYRIYYGDGTDSGYLPVGEYSFGTANPSFSVTKQYTATGEYFPYIITMPDYQTTSTSLVVAAALTAPTSTSIVSVSRLNNTQTRVVVSSTGGGGPYYQMFWLFSTTAPTSENRYDAASTTSTVTEDYDFSNGSTYYFYIRSSSENLGNTSTNGVGTPGTYSAYGPSSGAASYTFAQPSGTVSVSPSSGTAGTTTFTATPSVSASPSAEISYQWQYNDQGSLWLAAPNSITSPFNTTSSTYTPPSNYNSIYGSLLRCQITANNGVGTQLVTTSAVTVNAGISAPTSLTATTTRSDGVNLTFSGSNQATGYDIFWNTSQTANPSDSASPDFSNVSSPFLDTTISSSATRWYWVRGRNSSGVSSWFPSGNGVTGTRIAAPVKLATPTGVNATDTRTDGVNVTWNAVSGAAYYGVWYGPAPSYDSNPDFGGPSNPTLITGTSYLDTAIGAGVTRDYYVQAFSSGNPTGTKSDWGGPNSGTRIAAPVKLATPTGVSASDNRSDGINITWNAVSGASYYGVWWGGAPGYDSSPDFPNIFATSYFDSGAPVGSRNYYVQAFASGNPTGTKSDWGGPDSGTRTSVVVSAPATPTGVNTSGSGLVTWSASSGATSYTVEYYTATNSSGADQTGPYYGFPGNSTSFQVTYPVVNSVLQNWARARVLASNSGGNSAYSGFHPASGFA
jgi:hypothetical protein